MYAKHPRIAARWSKKEKASKDLPEKKKKSKKKTKQAAEYSETRPQSLLGGHPGKPGTVDDPRYLGPGVGWWPEVKDENSTYYDGTPLVGDRLEENLRRAHRRDNQDHHRYDWLSLLSDPDDPLYQLIHEPAIARHRALLKRRGFSTDDFDRQLRLQRSPKAHLQEQLDYVDQDERGEYGPPSITHHAEARRDRLLTPLLRSNLGLPVRRDNTPSRSTLVTADPFLGINPEYRGGYPRRDLRTFSPHLYPVPHHAESGYVGDEWVDVLPEGRNREILRNLVRWQRKHPRGRISALPQNFRHLFGRRETAFPYKGPTIKGPFGSRIRSGSTAYPVAEGHHLPPGGVGGRKISPRYFHDTKIMAGAPPRTSTYYEMPGRRVHRVWPTGGGLIGAPVPPSVKLYEPIPHYRRQSQSIEGEELNTTTPDVVSGVEGEGHQYEPDEISKFITPQPPFGLGSSHRSLTGGRFSPSTDEVLESGFWPITEGLKILPYLRALRRKRLYEGDRDAWMKRQRVLPVSPGPLHRRDQFLWQNPGLYDRPGGELGADPTPYDPKPALKKFEEHLKNEAIRRRTRK